MYYRIIFFIFMRGKWGVPSMEAILKMDSITQKRHRLQNRSYAGGSPLSSV